MRTRNAVLLSVALMAPAAVLLIGCGTPPTHEVISAPSCQAMLADSKPGGSNSSERWTDSLKGQLSRMGGWAPPPEWFEKPEDLRTGMTPAAGEYCVDITNELTTDIFKDISSGRTGAWSYFLYNPPSTGPIAAALVRPDLEYRSGKPLDGQKTLAWRTSQMLTRMDMELAGFLDRDGKCRKTPRNSLLMLGMECPVGVSVTSVYPQNLPREDRTGPAAATIDYDPLQNVTLSLSAVLNSPDVRDRIEYVSTFIYVHPYPFPPNGSISLNDELWKRFFSRYTPHTTGGKDKVDPRVVHADLCDALRSMTVRIEDVPTPDDEPKLDWGTNTRTSGITLNLNPSVAIPGSPVSLGQGSGMNATNTSSTVTNLQQQLDKRISYISPEADFLRLTLRGATLANASGRFSEHVHLRVPQAATPLFAVEIKPDNTTLDTCSLRLREIGQPLYRRVDAIVVSAAVVRHPIKYQGTRDETFGLPHGDAVDADFIAYVTYPSRITLWEWRRELDGVLVGELCPKLDNQALAGKLVYFDSPSGGINKAQPLFLACGDEVKARGFRGRIGGIMQCGKLLELADWEWKVLDSGRISLPLKEKIEKASGIDGKTDPFPNLVVAPTAQDLKDLSDKRRFVGVLDVKGHVRIRLGLRNDDSGKLDPFPASCFGPGK